MRFIYCLILICICSQNLLAQKYNLSGRIIDNNSALPIPNVNLRLISKMDSGIFFVTISDTSGNFLFNKIAAGKYILKGSILGYKSIINNLEMVDQSLILPDIKLSPSSILLKETEIESIQERVKQIGDTTQYNAGSYKVNEDANAEDLVKKMPGITSDNGTVKVNGEAVKQVYVDGKPFFGDDPNAALKNLPAEVIEKIQVFDKLSDQSQFTGFDDGQSNKTINIITKQGKQNGQFGKVYAGYGSDSRYYAGGNLNLFKGQRRISITGLGNNINQQNFSTQDIQGMIGNSGQSREGHTRGRPGSGGSGSPGMQGWNRSGDESSNFMVGQQPGITQTNAIGINYTDNWGKKIKTSGSLFSNLNSNNTEIQLERNYITRNDSGISYNETNQNKTTGYHTNFNFRFDYTLDSSNSILITPKLILSGSNNITLLNGLSSMGNNFSLGNTIVETINKNTGYSFSNNILFQHKFNIPKRTFSWNFGTDLNNKTLNINFNSKNNLFQGNDSILESDLKSAGIINGKTLSTNLAFTEPVGKFGIFQVNNQSSQTRNNSEKVTYTIDESKMPELNTGLSNQFNNNYFTNKTGLSYRLRKEKLNMMGGLHYQYALLESGQLFPDIRKTNRDFHCFLPQAMVNLKYSGTKNLRIIYRTAANAPNITQLQNVIDNSNPLLLKIGNPGLRQDFSQTVILRFGNTNPEKASGLFFFLFGNKVQNFIGNSTSNNLRDSILDNGLYLNKGSQVVRPENLSGYYNLRSFVTYAFPLSIIKSNCNFNTGYNFIQTPGKINNNMNYSKNNSINQGIVISSNINEKVDFSLSYTGSYNIINNSLQKKSDDNYFSQLTSAKINWVVFNRYVFQTNLNHTKFSGLSDGYNQSYLLLNASFGYKFLKDKSLELKALAYDILNQNKNIIRTVTDSYIEDSKSNILTRYYMVVLTYNLKRFNKE